MPMKENNNETCKWIGEGEGCTEPAVRKKSYCEKHCDRVYLRILPEMAEYIIEKELKESEPN